MGTLWRPWNIGKLVYVRLPDEPLQQSVDGPSDSSYSREGERRDVRCGGFLLNFSLEMDRRP